MTTLPPTHRLRLRRGFSLLESAIATLLAGVLMVGALRVVGASLHRQRRAGEDVTAQLLADELVAEILGKRYRDAQFPDHFGPETGEVSRSAFDDVDDYHGFQESPPRRTDGTTIDELTGWSRSVEVVWIAPLTLDPAADDQGASASRSPSRCRRRDDGSPRRRVAIRAEVPE